MADLVNLNRFRKEKARADKAAKAEENRARFGRSKAEKESEKRAADVERKRLDGHRLGQDPADPQS